MVPSITLKFSAASRSKKKPDISEPKAKVVRRKVGHREVVMPVTEKQKLLTPYGLCPYSLRPMFDVVSSSAQERRVRLEQLSGEPIQGRLEVLFPGQQPLAKNSVRLVFTPNTFFPRQYRKQIEEILTRAKRDFSPREIRAMASEIAKRADRISLDHILPQAWMCRNDVLDTHAQNNLLVTSTDENQARGDSSILACGDKSVAGIQINLRPVALSWFLSNRLNRVLTESRSFECVRPWVDVVSRFASEKDETQRQTALLRELISGPLTREKQPISYLKKPMAVDPIKNVVEFLGQCFAAGNNLWNKDQLQELGRRARDYAPEFTKGLNQALSKGRLA